MMKRLQMKDSKDLIFTQKTENKTDIKNSNNFKENLASKSKKIKEKAETKNKPKDKLVEESCCEEEVSLDKSRIVDYSLIFQMLVNQEEYLDGNKISEGNISLDYLVENLRDLDWETLDFENMLELKEGYYSTNSEVKNDLLKELYLELQGLDDNFLGDEKKTSFKKLLGKILEEIELSNKETLVSDENTKVSSTNELEVDLEEEPNQGSELIEKESITFKENSNSERTEKEPKEIDNKEAVNLNLTTARNIETKKPIIEGPSNRFINLSEFKEEDIVKQVVEKIDFDLGESKNLVTINLKPESLGKVFMELEVVKESLVAKINVDNIRAKEALENNVSLLRKELEKTGMEIKSFEVFVGNNSSFDRDAEERFNFFKQGKKMSKKKNTKEIKDISTDYERNTIEITRENNHLEGKSLNLFV